MTQKDNHSGNNNYFFFYGETKIEAPDESLSGSQLKALIKSAVAAFDPAHDLVLEGHGNEEDTVITDTLMVSLAYGHGEGGPKHFFSRPPANFGM
ncbi:MAG: hypothetical protein RBR35_00675 [Salinivirgaceae bacterium]|nr:hypothetical protein [Salinivirgaceae bacterium]